MPAQAGIQVTRHQIFWIPAFTGMAVCIAENSATAQLSRLIFTFTGVVVKLKLEQRINAMAVLTLQNG